MLQCPVVRKKMKNTVGAPDLQSKIRILENPLQHDLDLKKSTPLTALCYAVSKQSSRARLTNNCETFYKKKKKNITVEI